MTGHSISPKARQAAKEEADRFVLAEAKAVALERQAKSAALRRLRLEKESAASASTSNEALVTAS